MNHASRVLRSIPNAIGKHSVALRLRSGKNGVMLNLNGELDQFHRFNSELSQEKRDIFR